MNDQEAQAVLGAALRKAREAAGLTGAQLAERAGFTTRSAEARSLRRGATAGG